MTARIVLSCDATLPSGMPCRGALPTRTMLPSTAEVQAREAGWTLGIFGDVCPSCTRRGAEL